MKFTRHICHYCEGTGHRINDFDRPRHRSIVGSDSIPDVLIDQRHYTPSGREMYEDKCGVCWGTGVLVVDIDE